MRGNAHGGFEVGFSLVRRVMVHLHGSAPDIAAGKARRRGNRLIGYILQQLHVATLRRYLRQFLLGAQPGGIQVHCLAKALLSQSIVALPQRRHAQPVLDESVLGVVLGALHEGIYGIARLAIVEQHDSVQSRNFRILGVLLHQAGDHGFRGRVVLDLKKNANVSLLHRRILGILRGQACKLGLGLVHLPGAFEVVCQDANALGIVGQVIRGLAEDLFDSRPIALQQNNLGQAFPSRKAFGVRCDCIPAGLFSVLQAAVAGIE